VNRRTHPVSNVLATKNIELCCADLFAGAGGFSLGAQAAGLRVVMAAESDVHAVATYHANFVQGRSKPPVVHDGDIRKLHPSSVAKKMLASTEICDLILGGPPCQGFSTHRIKDAGIEDGRNELIHTYFEFVKALKPSAFLMENVPGMLWPRHKAYLDKFLSEARLAGYDVYKPCVLDARDYGIPQRRKRVFILGIRGDVDKSTLIWPPHPTHGNARSVATDPTLKPWENCASAFAPAPPNDANDVHMNSGAELVKAFENTPANGGSRHSSGRLLSCHNGHDGHNDVYGRIDPSQPAPTMTTACINPSKGRFVHPEKHHGITPRQAARIQTFPDSFKFTGGLMAAGKQVGNAVPVKLAAALISHLVPLLEAERQSAASSFSSKRCEKK
jgi:DNA (cytosine-5)-methyltransferase 1